MRQVMMLVVVIALGAIGCRPAATPIAVPTLSPLAAPTSPPAAVPTAVPTLEVSPKPTSTAAPKSGLQVTATIGPTCPGPQRVGQVCTAPYVGEFIVSTREGREVARFTTDDQGRSKLDLPPGDYSVSPKLDSARGLPRGGPIDVQVIAGAYTEVMFELDTGMR
ncbi:MAG TPA: hypothetical protein VFF59_05290 [Anaerolineae bacterium]|nr:hypothetical protein [Anaerolineae bacterium]